MTEKRLYYTCIGVILKVQSAVYLIFVERWMHGGSIKRIWLRRHHTTIRSRMVWIHHIVCTTVMGWIGTWWLPVHT